MCIHGIPAWAVCHVGAMKSGSRKANHNRLSPPVQGWNWVSPVVMAVRTTPYGWAPNCLGPVRVPVVHVHTATDFTLGGQIGDRMLTQQSILVLLTANSVQTYYACTTLLLPQ